MKKLTAALLCAILLFSVAGCKGGDGKENKVELYSVYITDKVLQDIDADDSLKRDAAFSVTAVRGESEGSQIVFKPEKDISACTYTFGDLKKSDGTLFSVSNFEVFFQKYIEIKSRSKWHQGPGELGFYPDMLLPFDKAVEYGENKVKAGENQSIVLVANVPAEQAAGQYAGTFTLTLDGKNYDIPVSLHVYDIELPAVGELKSSFIATYSLLTDGELNGTQEMYEAYCDALIKYKVDPLMFPGASASTDTFKAMVRKYYDQVTCIQMPSDSYTAYKAGNLEKYALALAEISLEDGINYFDKANYSFLYSVDEPGLNGTYDKATDRIKIHNDDLKTAAAKVRALATPDHENVTKEEIAAGIEKIYPLISNAYTDRISGEHIIWCPSANNLNYDYQREYYLNDADTEYWAYTLNSTVYPQPNYHIDDMNNLMSSRAFGWMANQYGVTGILYYETCFMQKVSYTGGFHYEKCDPYTEPMKYPETNGDGWLFYPGAKYGIFGPIATNRLNAIRDCMEDNETLRILERLYAAEGYDADGILHVLYDSMWSGTAYYANSEKFHNARIELLNLIELAQNGVFITDVHRSAAGYTFKTAGDAQIKLNEVALSADGDGIYQAALSAAANTLRVQKGAAAFTYSLGGKKQYALRYSAGDTVGIANSKSYQTEIADGSECGASGKVGKVTFNDAAPASKTVYIRPNGISSLLTKNTQEISLEVYNPTDKKTLVNLYIEGDNAIMVNQYYLAPGKNTLIAKNIHAAKWSSIKSASGIRLLFEDANTPQTLYVGDIIITEVAA